MANKTLFASKPSSNRIVPATSAVNNAGGRAYELHHQEALAQYVVTGTLGGTFYCSAEHELKKTLELADKCSPEFVAKCAIYSRQFGKMKDMPALLLAHLSTRGEDGVRLVKQIFPRVITNTKMLRNFFQIIRSGQVGRKNFGTALRNCMSDWLSKKSMDQLFDGSIGNDPKLGDVIKLSHIKPSGKDRENFHNYLLGRKFDHELLPARIRQYELYKAGKTDEVPNVPFDFLSSMDRLGTAEWTEIARNAPWNMTRMNLNTFNRHGVLKDAEMVRLIAARLRDPESVHKFNAFPYQIMTALNHTSGMPSEIVDALQDALDISLDNVPSFGDRVAICLDVSGSMSSTPVTGKREAASQVMCIKVAALMASAIMRKNRNSLVVPFEGHVVTSLMGKLNPRDSVWTNAEKLSSIGGGSTNCGAALQFINSQPKAGLPDLVIYVSDNESWVDSSNQFYRRHSGTEVMNQFGILRRTRPNAKMVCIDLAANATSQAPSQSNILNVGGFSDAVFDVIDRWVKGEGNFVATIEKVSLDNSVEIE